MVLKSVVISLIILGIATGCGSSGSSGEDYLIVTPSEATIYRGCVIFKITSLDQASIERIEGTAKATAVFEAHGDFNGACGYVEGLSGSGVMISEAFTSSVPVFRLFTTDYHF